MQDAVVRAIIVQSKKLADIAMESRPTADRGSVEVGASVALLIVAIHILNQTAPNEPAMRMIIDGVVEELPRKISERKVSLESALPIVAQREMAAQHIGGAYNTNVLGAFQAIYNSRVEDDIHFINTHSDGPMGDMGGMTVIVGRYLMPEGKTPPGMKISAVIGEFMGEMAKPSKPSNKGSGSSKCFVATACFECPDNPNVLYLRQFRDQVLKRSALGRAFVRFYYKKGPALAGLIQNRPVWRAVVRGLLSSVVSLIKVFHD